MDKRSILITGCGGFLGRFILDHYVRHYPDYHFFLLEQGSFLTNLKKRLETEYPSESSAGRFCVFEGDITRSDLGIDKGLRQRISDHTIAAIHLAALYHLAAPREVSMQINVEGTRHVLDFCSALRQLRRFAHVSTIAVAGTYRGIFDERDFDVGQGFKNYYEETKFLAEQLIRDYTSDFSTFIFRPAVVMGHSKTGFIDKVDGPYYLWVSLARRLLLIAPDSGPVRNNVAPVDFIAEALVELFEKETAIAGTAFTLIDPNPLSYNEFLDQSCACWPRRKPLLRLPYRYFAPLARRRFFEWISGIPWQAFQYADQDIRYTAPETTERLAALGVHCPPFTDYLPMLVQYFKDHLQDQALRRGNWRAVLRQ